jgi:hypothetical protein
MKEGADPTRKISEDASENRLVRDDEQRLGVGLHLLYARLEARDEVKVRLAARISVSDFIHLAQLVRLWVVHLDFLSVRGRGYTWGCTMSKQCGWGYIWGYTSCTSKQA